jgi:hypothetical protein
MGIIIAYLLHQGVAFKPIRNKKNRHRAGVSKTPMAVAYFYACQLASLPAC